MLRATFPDGSGVLVDYLHALTMWKYREEDVWKELNRIDHALTAFKPARVPLRNWREQLDRFRNDRRSMTGGVDIDGGNDHLWIMRVLRSVQNEPWYTTFRKQMAQDDLKGSTITDVETLWRMLEFQETYKEPEHPTRHVGSTYEKDRPKPYEPRNPRAFGNKFGRFGDGGRGGGKGGSGR